MVLDFVVGVTDTIVDYPFDSFKVCLQTQTLNYLLYSDSLDYFIKITRQKSILGFYKDMSSSMFAVAIINRMVFFLLKICQKNLSNDPNTYFALAITGGIADCTQAFICSSVEFIKTYLQMQVIGQ